MQNIEIKAHYPDLAKARQHAETLGAASAGRLVQTDTYFRVPNGRLKLREIEGQENQLIFYERPDQTGPKTSDYRICPVSDAPALRSTLAAALGIWQVVKKTRELYLHDEVRIHLDQVENLGNFVEFEGVLAQGLPPETVRRKVEHLVAYFDISATSLITGSYSDLIASSQ